MYMCTLFMKDCVFWSVYAIEILSPHRTWIIIHKTDSGNRVLVPGISATRVRYNQVEKVVWFYLPASTKIILLSLFVCLLVFNGLSTSIRSFKDGSTMSNPACSYPWLIFIFVANLVTVATNTRLKHINTTDSFYVFSISTNMNLFIFSIIIINEYASIHIRYSPYPRIWTHSYSVFSFIQEYEFINSYSVFSISTNMNLLIFALSTSMNIRYSPYPRWWILPYKFWTIQVEDFHI